MRKVANRVRMTGQLIDAASGAHIWADRFESTLDDIFALQDQMAESVVGAIAPRLEQAEIERAKRKPTENLNAYDCFLRGMAAWHDWTQSSHNSALKLFYRAIELDPEFGRPYALAAGCYLMRKSNGWIIDRAAEIAETERLARLGADLGRTDAVALAWSAHALALVVGDIKTGIALVDHALRLNANLAVAWQRSGWIRIYAGDCELAIEHLKRAMRLSPCGPLDAPGTQRDGIRILPSGQRRRGLGLGRARATLAIELAPRSPSVGDEQCSCRSGAGRAASHDPFAADPTAIASFEPPRANLSAAARAHGEVYRGHEEGRPA